MEKTNEVRRILDTVSVTQQNAALRTFNVTTLVHEILEKLSNRDREVLISRYGLGDGFCLTLEQIGKRLNLTRERIRQIEKEALKKLNSEKLPLNFESGVSLIFQIIEEHGNIAQENLILDAALLNNNTEVSRKGILFLLNLVSRFSVLKESAEYRQSWYVGGFDREIFDKVANLAKAILEKEKKPLSQNDFFQRVREQSENGEIKMLSDQALESYISISKNVDRNPYHYWGLVDWPEIRPNDVGDKAYLVLLHNNKPEHYEKITELINKQEFDKRVAHKETVHNELIKDDRFVLIGRGIYALKEWGYKTGVVADIIGQILRSSGRSLSRDEILNEVLKQRMVKRNTIIVSLSNRKRFQKTSDGKYIEAQNV